MKKRILLLEDQADLAWVTTEWLRRIHCEVTIVENGLEALKVLEKDAFFDLIITDYQMPQMNGHQFLEVWRQHSQWSSIPAVIYSSHGHTEIIARQMGVPLLVKGRVMDDEFVLAVQSLLGL